MAPQRGILSSVRILIFNHLFQPPPIFFFQNSYPSLQTKHQLRNGKKVRCVLLKMSVYVKIKDKPSVKLRKIRGFHTHRAAGISFRLNPNTAKKKKKKVKAPPTAIRIFLVKAKHHERLHAAEWGRVCRRDLSFYPQPKLMCSSLPLQHQAQLPLLTKSAKSIWGYKTLQRVCGAHKHKRGLLRCKVTF